MPLPDSPDKAIIIDPSSQAIADAISQGIVAGLKQNAGVQKVKNGQESQVSPFNPSGNKKRQLNRAMFVHGQPLNVRQLSDEEIALLNSDKIRPGRYCEKLITVREEESEDGTGAKSIYIDWSNKTPNQRLTMEGLAPTFAARLRRITTEESK